MNFQFNHNNTNVLKLERSLKFYEEALGLKEVKRYQMEDGGIKKPELSELEFRLSAH